MPDSPRINRPGSLPRLSDGQPFTLDRDRILDGTIPVFWGPGQVIGRGTVPHWPYRPPTDWPQDRLIRVPRVVRWIDDARSAFGGARYVSEGIQTIGDLDYLVYRFTYPDGRTFQTFTYASRLNGSDDFYASGTQVGPASGGSGVTPTYSNAARWRAIADAIQDEATPPRNLWFARQRIAPSSLDIAGELAPHPPASAPKVYFGTDNLIFLILSDQRYAPATAPAGDLQAIRDAFAKFAGYRVLIFVDGGFLDQTEDQIADTPWSRSVGLYTPGGKAILIAQATAFAAMLADQGVRYGGEVSYLTATPARFLDAISAAWPDLA